MIRQQEPLTPEERELAAHILRLGPHGEPSPTLDSRIMAAAHAELAGAELAKTDIHKRKPRWPVALGLAASVLLAVGVAWQLRPLQEAPTASEVPSAAAAPEPVAQAPVETQATEQAEQAVAVADVAAPPIAPPQAFPAAPESESATPTGTRTSPRQMQKPAKSDTAPTVAARGKASAPTAASKPETRKAQRLSPPPEPAPASPPPPPAPAPIADAVDTYAGAAASAPVHIANDAERAVVQAEQAAQAKRARDEATSGRLLMRESGQRRRQASAPPPASAAAQDAIAEEAGGARATLRRTDLQLPVAEDAKLATAEWLDRIRLRRDLGDSANATASLRMFVDAHPFQRVPEDLRPLLGEE